MNLPSKTHGHSYLQFLMLKRFCLIITCMPTSNMGQVHQKLPVVHILSVHLSYVKTGINSYKSSFLLINYHSTIFTLINYDLDHLKHVLRQ